MKLDGQSGGAGVLEVTDLFLSLYARRRRVDVLKGVSLSVPTGDRVALVGASGAGKSSLLYCLAGLLVPTSGTVSVDGVDLSRLTEGERAQYRLRRVGLVYQAFHLLGGLDAIGNVSLPMRLAGMPRAEAEDRAHALLGRVGLSERARHRPHQLSGGEQQRVAVARAVANAPDVLLADEPTGNLDDESADQVLSLLVDPDLGAKTVVVATHDPRVAGRLGSQIRLKSGRLADEEATDVAPVTVSAVSAPSAALFQ